VVQPVVVADVADVPVQVAVGAPRHGVVELAGEVQRFLDRMATEREFNELVERLQEDER
jgi:hypothetical protein